MSTPVALQPAQLKLDVGVRVAQLAKEQTQAQGEIIMNLISAAAPTQTVAPAPEGNLGNNIDVHV
ncbi:putative motility protein [Shewanella avicenniae]|uniref:Motility protein n=1 Tax=Shewanella avicenniae TaxID=2814294 RepID=A0ABX7QNS7_9GAMM|nr:putative motility protein [Shewanella avicenniae]QSX33024.1 putative motility protein [Shewanella avicenniae]